MAQLEEQRRIEEQKRREEAERRAREEELRRQMEAEEAQLQAQRGREMERLKAQYIASIAGKVQRNWRRPGNVAEGATCHVLVSQIPGGEVVSARVTSCTGDEAFRRSVESAVYRASPLPAAPDPGVFDRDIRFTFEAED